MASSAGGAEGAASEETGGSPVSPSGEPEVPASPTAREGKLCCGRCKWFDVTKGYGFLTPDDKSGDVFVYQSSILMSGFRSLDENEAVEFIFKTSEKGREAETVTGPKGAPCKGCKRKGKGKRRRDDRCYNCNEHGHHAKNCHHPPLPKRCHHCKSEDHLVADCPDKPAQSSQGNDTDGQGSNSDEASAGAPPPPTSTTTDQGDGGTS